MKAIINLPLPPSKNKRTIRKGFYSKKSGKWMNAPLLTQETLSYRNLVNLLLAGFHNRFSKEKKIVLECFWTKTRRNQDCANWHDEICDSIAPALGLDDKMFLVRDMDFIQGKSGAVKVIIYELGEL